MRQLIAATTVSLLALSVWADGVIDFLPDGITTTVLASPGSYRLAGSVTMAVSNEDCIQITGDNVTLDLNGHTLTGLPGGTQVGILIDGHRARVHSGTVQEFSPYGVRCNGDEMLLEDVRALENSTGFFIWSAFDMTMRTCEASQNTGRGIEVPGGGSMKMIDCIMEGNGSNGLFMSGAHSRPLLSGNIATNNGGTGFSTSGGVGLWVNNLSLNNTGDFSGIGLDNVSSVAASNEWGDNLTP